MENFSVKANRTIRYDNDKIYIEYVPENTELVDYVGHGMVVDIVGTVAETVTFYEETAATEMFIEVQGRFPNAYQLDAKYG